MLVLIQTFFFFVVVVPFLAIQAAHEKSMNHIDEHDLWDHILWILIGVLILAVIILYLNGYRL